jgi:hypothetical protein
MSEHDDETRRTRDAGEGYPEEGRPGTGIDPRDHPEEDVAEADDAPRTSTEEDGDPDQATGNRRAAGGA